MKASILISYSLIVSNINFKCYKYFKLRFTGACVKISIIHNKKVMIGRVFLYSL